MAVEIIEIISYAPGQSSLRGLPGERYIQATNYPGSFTITFKSVTRKRIGCFVIVLTAAHATNYEEILISGGLGPAGPINVEVNVLREWTTTLWSEDFSNEFIKGESLNDFMMDQLPTIQDAVDGYLQERRIEERASGPDVDSGVLMIINMNLVTTLDPDWNPSE